MPDLARRTKPKIIVLYNENPDWPQDDKDWSGEMLAMMWAGLRERNYSFTSIKFFDNLSALDDYDPAEWLIWNWGEEMAGRPWSEAEVAAELDRRGFAYTGSPGPTFRLAQNRMQVKERLEAAGLPTLPACVFNDPAQAEQWSIYPAIVKGLNQHSSYGIGRNSVVHSPADLARQIVAIREAFDDAVLVEQFLDTREFHVAVWGNGQPQALPPVQYDYSVFSDMHDRLYTYEWKFDRNSRGFKEIKMLCPAPADEPRLRARLEEVAVAAYSTIGVRDYGRIDLRMLGDEPQILDVNPNPDLKDVDVLPLAAQQLGLNFGQLIDRILRFASERMPVRRAARRRPARQAEAGRAQAAGD